MTQLEMSGMPQRGHSLRLEYLPWGSEPIWLGDLGQPSSSEAAEALQLLLSQPPCQIGCARCADNVSVYGMELARLLALDSAYSVRRTLEGAP